MTSFVEVAVILCLKYNLLFGLSFGDIIPSNFDPWSKEGLNNPSHRNAEQVTDFLGNCKWSATKYFNQTIWMKWNINKQSSNSYCTRLTHPNWALKISGFQACFNLILTASLISHIYIWHCSVSLKTKK